MLKLQIWLSDNTLHISQLTCTPTISSGSRLRFIYDKVIKHQLSACSWHPEPYLPSFPLRHQQSHTRSVSASQIKIAWSNLYRTALKFMCYSKSQVKEKLGEVVNNLCSVSLFVSENGDFNASAHVCLFVVVRKPQF